MKTHISDNTEEKEKGNGECVLSVRRMVSNSGWIGEHAIWQRGTYIHEPRARTPVTQSQVYFHLYVCVYKQTRSASVLCVWVNVCYARYGSDAFCDTPCEFQIQSQQRNSQLAMPKLANHVREKHPQPHPPTPNPLFFSPNLSPSP